MLRKVLIFLLIILSFCTITITTSADEADVLLEEDYEGEKDAYWLYTPGVTTTREFIRGDGVNTSNFIQPASGNTALGYYTLSREVKGTVVVEFRAKTFGQTYFSFETRQNSDYLKTSNITLVSQGSGIWRYYRFVIEYGASPQTAQVYSSETGWSSLSKISSGNARVTFTDTTGFNMIRFTNCALDDFRLLYYPENGEYYSNVKSGAENVDVSRAIDVVYYQEMDASTFTTDNIKLINAENQQECEIAITPGVFGFTVNPVSALSYETEYLLTGNNIETRDGDVSTLQIGFKTMFEPLFEPLTLDSYTLFTPEGDISEFGADEESVGFRAVLSSKDNQATAAEVILALCRNYDDSIDSQVSFVSETAYIDSGETGIVVETPLIDIPAHASGEYSLKVFI